MVNAISTEIIVSNGKDTRIVDSLKIEDEKQNPMAVEKYFCRELFGCLAHGNSKTILSFRESDRHLAKLMVTIVRASTAAGP